MLRRVVASPVDIGISSRDRSGNHGTQVTSPAVPRRRAVTVSASRRFVRAGQRDEYTELLQGSPRSCGGERQEVRFCHRPDVQKRHRIPRWRRLRQVGDEWIEIRVEDHVPHVRNVFDRNGGGPVIARFARPVPWSRPSSGAVCQVAPAGMLQLRHRVLPAPPRLFPHGERNTCCRVTSAVQPPGSEPVAGVNALRRWRPGRVCWSPPRLPAATSWNGTKVPDCRSPHHCRLHRHAEDLPRWTSGHAALRCMRSVTSVAGVRRAVVDRDGRYGMGHVWACGARNQAWPLSWHIAAGLDRHS
jgi:hypothetical protein